MDLAEYRIANYIWTQRTSVCKGISHVANPYLDNYGHKDTRKEDSSNRITIKNERFLQLYSTLGSFIFK